jgi:hypothetical protein
VALAWRWNERDVDHRDEAPCWQEPAAVPTCIKPVDGITRELLCDN